MLEAMPYLLAAGKTVPLTRETKLGSPAAANGAGPNRHHARLFPQDGGWWLEDLHSEVDTLVNGRKLLTGAVRLKTGDTIAIGALTVAFHEGDPPAAKAATPSERLAVGTKVGSYTVVAHLDDGVATCIYKASHANGQVALHVADRALVDGDDDFAKRFLTDIELAANVRHPGAVRIHRAGAIAKSAWYSTDIAAGTNLQHALGTPMDPAVALDICLALGEILVAYGEVGLVHGDLKPRSLGMVGERSVRLMDIGLIGLNAAERQRAQARGATRQAYYLCPVQATRGDCNARSDLYSMGCMLVQMLTGRPPYLGANFAEIVAAHQREPVPELAERLGLPYQFDAALVGLLHKDPAFRYDTTALALTRLREVRAALAAPVKR